LLIGGGVIVAAESLPFESSRLTVIKFGVLGSDVSIDE
jgi:hypothetical protein